MLTFLMSYLAILYFVDLYLVPRVRAVTNTFPDLPNFAFDPDDVVSIMSRMPIFLRFPKSHTCSRR